MPELQRGSVEWWLHRLNAKLTDRKKLLQRRADYYEGRHPLIFATDRFREAFAGTVQPYADNFTARVVDATAERLAIDGLRIASDELATDEAWRIWTANRMELVSSMLFREVLVKSEASVIVWAGRDRETPRITVEDPMQVIVETAAGDRLERVAALKRWTDGDTTYATLYLPAAIYKFQGAANDEVLEQSGLGAQFGRWKRRETRGEPWPIPNPLGEVPVVPVINRPTLSGDGRSEIEPVIPLQDAINKTGADLLVASEYAAFRQRWATGLDMPTDPKTGEPIPIFQAALETLWAVSDPNVKFGEFDATDLTNYVNAIEMQVQHLASISGIPVHYLLNTGVVPSGESQTAAESPLVSKVRDRQIDYADPLAVVQRLVWRVRDEPSRAAAPIHIVWRDPERRTPSEFVDSLVKEKALGVPDEILWEKRGYTKQEIDRIKAIRLQQEIEASIQQTEILGSLLDRGVSPEAAARIAGIQLGATEVTVPEAPVPTNGVAS